MKPHEKMSLNPDDQHLQLLSVFHYVVAGITALFSLFPCFHLIMGVLMLTGAFEDAEHSDFPATIVGSMFVIIPALMIACGMAMALSIAIAGRKLAARRGHTFCLVVAAIECCFMPFGTVLGVFTIIVLLRPSVKELFVNNPFG